MRQKSEKPHLRHQGSQGPTLADLAQKGLQITSNQTSVRLRPF